MILRLGLLIKMYKMFIRRNSISDSDVTLDLVVVNKNKDLKSLSDEHKMNRTMRSRRFFSDERKDNLKM